ncbi:MAG: UDP-2,3-diacylglucosamine diphosphatase LpxI [Alphaproteobacteria bacterium]|nr:MAG: UDP-2,3-diacylglucosamine diphosphatase LpxI [Alphaproteobacteria bacterium]
MVDKILGIIAGGGAAPRRLIQACAQYGRPVFVVALRGQTDDETVEGGVPYAWHALDRTGDIRDTLRSKGVEEIVLIGRVRRPSLTELRPDAFTLARLARVGLGVLGDDGLLSAVAREIEREGFRLLGAHEIHGDLLTPSGVLGAHAPDETALADVKRATAVARALGRLDVGQSVVVQQGLVLGVEAIEGTDALLERCAGLRRDGLGGVLVKLCKPEQDRRFDLPSAGPATIQHAANAGLRGVALEAQGTLLLDRGEAVALADRLGLFLLGLAPQEIDR